MFIQSINAAGGHMPESQQNSGEKTCAFHIPYLPEFSQGSQGTPPESGAEGRKKDVRSLELPRGRFREVRRCIKLAFLLHDLADDRFTGYCKILHEQGGMVIVFKEGIIILAENKGASGDEALEIIVGCRDTVVDAELNELDESQLKLALEFNSQSRVDGGGLIDRRLISCSDEGPGITPERLSHPECAQDASAPPDIAADRVVIGHQGTGVSEEQDTPGMTRSLPTPLSHFIDPSLSKCPVKSEEMVTNQEENIAFEQLDGNSVLFESRQDVNRGLLKDVPDASERWRSMGITRRENFSV
jgi:hypothetical protein